MSEVLSVTDGDFEAQVLQSGDPVLVDFWAEWCAPCRMLKPVLDDVATEYADKVKIVKIDVDENRDTAAKFGIRTIPTLLLFKGGENIASVNGMKSKSQLIAFLDSHL